MRRARVALALTVVLLAAGGALAVLVLHVPWPWVVVGIVLFGFVMRGPARRLWWRAWRSDAELIELQRRLEEMQEEHEALRSQLEELRTQPAGRVIQAARGEGLSDPRGRRSVAKVEITPSQAPANRDVVHCTVFAPPRVNYDDAWLVQVWAHTQAQAQEVRAAALEFGPEATRRATAMLTEAVARGSRLTFEVEPAPHGNLIIQDPVQHCVWHGKPDYVTFAVRLDPDADLPTVTLVTYCTIRVSHGSVPIGRLEVGVTFSRRYPTKPAAEQSDAWKRYRRAFISYASENRAEVLSRVPMLTAVGIDYFQDVLHLDPGDRWERELYRHIDESDVVLLFWSTPARKSQWVRREYLYALGYYLPRDLGQPPLSPHDRMATLEVLDRRGSDTYFRCPQAPVDIRPVILEGPPFPDPPEELKHLHFSDKVRYLIAAEER